MFLRLMEKFALRWSSFCTWDLQKQSTPDHLILGKSDTGWMKADIFYEHIVNALDDWLTDNSIRRPVLLFIDIHKSHMTMALSEACKNRQMILYALPPNTTHTLQPTDISVLFRPLKQEWKSTLRHWQSKPENVNCSVTKTNFCKLIAEALENTDMLDDIKNGFRKCGLFPYNPDAVDYSKCVQNILETLRKHVQPTEPCLNENIITEQDIKSTEKIIKKIKENLESYEVCTEVIFNGIRFLKDDMDSGYRQLKHRCSLLKLTLVIKKLKNRCFLVKLLLQWNQTEKLLHYRI